MSDNNDILILFFGQLATTLGASSMSYPLSQKNIQVAQLIKELINNNKSWDSLLSPDIKFAVNQSLAEKTTIINPGDEVAFFPPVTGG